MIAADVDVLIAGGGPAGIATAVGLVQHGVAAQRVLVIDRARFPREKPCGGGLTGHAALAMDELWLKVRVRTVDCHGGRIVYGGRREDVTLDRPVRVVRRDEFDADLVAQARARGVPVCEGEGLEGFEVDARGVRARTTLGRSLTARVLVGADGVGSGVRRWLARGVKHVARQPLRLCRAEIAMPSHLNGDRMVYDFTPLAAGLRGYVWLFPAPGGLNVGALHFPAGPAADLGGSALDRVLGQALQRFGVRLSRPARGWPAWAYDGSFPLSQPHVLLVGDAAGIDALTGEGIAVALAHGQGAAGLIAAGLRSGDLSFSSWTRDVRTATVGRELALDGVFARLLYGSPDPLAWLGLVMEDARMRALYAARVCGSAVLADRKGALLAALGRHLFLGAARGEALRRAGATSP